MPPSLFSAPFYTGLQAMPWLSPWEGLLDESGIESIAKSVSPRFVPPSVMADNALPGEGYEAYIHRTGQVPTRDNWHDLFNALVWLRFPLAKARMNHLHVQEIAQRGAASPRGPVRDALTVFDENGALLQCPDALWEALANKDWQRLFVTGRHLWQQTQLVLFGHALMEKLLSPRKGMVTHVYRLNTGLALADIAQTDPDFIAHLDRHLAETLTPRQLASKPFAPLPVLGVPGWWPPNEAPGFYDDVAVFRPPRHPPESCQPQSAPAAHGRQS